MRRAVIFIILIAIAFGIAVATYTAYNFHKEELKRDDLTYEELTLYSDGTVSGKFLCETVGSKICDYTYVVEDNKLYITIYVTKGDKTALEANDEGLIELKFENLGKIEKIYYRDSKKDHVLSFDEE